MMKKVLCMILLILCAPSAASSRSFTYTPVETMVGETTRVRVTGSDSLIEMARRYDLGYNEITDANPGIDPFVPGDGVEIALPLSWVLPEADRVESVLINLSELRLYYFSGGKGKRTVETYPIGIGSEGHNTPEGVFHVVEKMENPPWYVPKSILEEKPELPKIVPPGPDNPLGTHALRLSDRTILMHGTNRPYAVGRLASHGCIRLYPEDIPKLFRAVPRGTMVKIVRQPVKAAARNNRVYVEVHDDPEANMNYFDAAVTLLRKKGLLLRTSITKLHEALERRDGIPADITE